MWQRRIQIHVVFNECVCWWLLGTGGGIWSFGFGLVLQLWFDLKEHGVISISKHACMHVLYKEVQCCWLNWANCMHAPETESGVLTLYWRRGYTTRSSPMFSSLLVKKNAKMWSRETRRKAQKMTSPNPCLRFQMLTFRLSLICTARFVSSLIFSDSEMYSPS